MATLPGGSSNLESSASGSPPKKKYTRTRSKAYRKRRSARRRKQSFYKSKRLQRFLIHKTKKLQMSSSVKQMFDRPSGVIQQSPDRWQDRSEIAYWKSRALSLELENNMLYKHIEDLYTNMVLQKSHTTENSTQNNGCHTNLEHEDNEEEDIAAGEFNKEGRQFRMERDKERCLNTKNTEDQICSQPPIKRDPKEREEELKKLYGSAWRAVLGMETVVQLNYDITLDKQKINYWPILPIKL